MSKEQNHIHKLKRHAYKTTGSRIFHCVLPDCYFKVEVPLSLGKRTICWRCGDVTEINEYSIRSAKPICWKCIKKRGNKPNGNPNRRSAQDRRSNDRRNIETETIQTTKQTDTLPAVKDYSLDKMREILAVDQDDDL